MNHNSEFEKSLAQAHKVLSLLVERRCPATPQNFELWYNYAAGHDRRLMDQIDQAVTEEGTLPQSAASKIYDETLSPAVDSKQVTDISKQVSTELTDVMQMLEQASGNTSDYSRSLSNLSQELHDDAEQSDLKTIVEGLVSSTQRMEQQNKDLETRLNSSQQQIAELNSNLETARTESRIDQLTGIANRKAFDETIKEMTAVAIDEGQDLCLLMGDIDHFKKFNDSFGHQTGDQVLRLVAACLTSVLKGQDFAARYGGEEFVVLLPETQLQAAITVGNHLRKTVMSKKLVKKSTGEDLGHVTMSFGAARFRPGESIDSWIHRADACLYAAKRAGRNQVKCETDPGIDHSINAA